MEILKALEKAAENSAEYQKKRIEALKKNPVAKEDWVPSEYTFVADLDYYLRHILGTNKSKRLILETTPYISNKNRTKHYLYLVLLKFTAQQDLKRQINEWFDNHSFFGFP